MPSHDIPQVRMHVTLPQSLVRFAVIGRRSCVVNPEFGGEWLDSFESNSLEISTAAVAELASAGY